MIIPIGDSPNARMTPWVTYGLIAANVVVFVMALPLMASSPDQEADGYHEYVDALIDGGRVKPRDVPAVLQRTSEYDLLVFERGIRPAKLDWMDFLTSMFLHGGLGHLLGNMLFLFIFADNLEARLGRKLFLGFYLATGVAAGLGDVVLRWGSTIPSVGASGAISGVLGAYFIWFPANRVRLFVFFFPFIMRTFAVSARWVLGFYLVAQNILPWLLSGGNTGVSYGAHIGGFIAGVAAAYALGGRPKALSAGAPAVEQANSSWDTEDDEEPLELAEEPRWKQIDPAELNHSLRTFLALADGEVAVMPLSRIEELGRRLSHSGRLHDAAVIYERTLRVRGAGRELNGVRLAFALVLRKLGGFEAQYRQLANAVLADPRSDQEILIARAFVFKE